MRRNVKKEKQTDKGDASAEPVRTKVAGVGRDESADVESNQPNREEDATDRRVDETGAEEKTDTDRNMAVMFEILRRKRQVKLESLILNRSSFAQAFENLFALSFLVKDGRAEIVVHGSGSHIVSPKNAPAASSIASGEAAYSHFVFRFDFKD
ncbi:hypothetical protein GOBAR_DD24336 [Gossypium barbadense]|nr:hypothetical protein GOBAR_DD24336 [Gossypium barbadense]